MIQAPPLPDPLVYVLWALAGLAVVAGGLWGVFSWLLGRIDERFRAAIRGEDFERVIDKRVAAAFDGATGPLLAAQRELAGTVAVAQRTADAAHRRMDEHLDRHA